MDVCMRRFILTALVALCAILGGCHLYTDPDPAPPDAGAETAPDAEAMPDAEPVPDAESCGHEGEACCATIGFPACLSADLECVDDVCSVP